MDGWACYGLLAHSEKADHQFHFESFSSDGVSASPHEEKNLAWWSLDSSGALSYKVSMVRA